MHKNTYLLVSILAVFAALLIGVNIGRIINNSPSTVPSPTPIPEKNMLTYSDLLCGFSLNYPATMNILDGASGSAVLINPEGADQSVVITCQKEIPRPALLPEKTEKRILTNIQGTASVSAILYHDASAKDGAPIDSLIFRIPGTTLDVFIAGFGDTFNEIIRTVKLTQ